MVDRDGETVINQDAIYAASEDPDKFPWHPEAMGALGKRGKSFKGGGSGGGGTPSSATDAREALTVASKDAASRAVDSPFMVTVIGASRHRLEAYANSVSFSAPLDGHQVT